MQRESSRTPVSGFAAEYRPAHVGFAESVSTPRAVKPPLGATAHVAEFFGEERGKRRISAVSRLEAPARLTCRIDLRH